MPDIAAPATSTPTNAGPTPAPVSRPAAAAAPTPKATPAPVSAATFRQGLNHGQFTGDDIDGDFDAPEIDDNDTEITHNLPTTEPDSSEYTSEEEALGTEEPGEDLAWLQELKDYKELHGLPIQEILAALKDGRLPDALLEKIMVELKDGSDTETVSLSKARDGAMMRRNYTKKLTSFHQERDAFNGEKDQFVGMVREWNTPEGLYKGMKALGLPFLEAAKILAAEEQAMDEMEAKAPGSRALHEAKAKAENEAEQLRREMARLQSTQSKKTEESTNEQVVNFVRTTAPAEFEKLGIRLNDGTWEVFKMHLNALWKEHGTPNEAMVKFAVEATRDEVNAWAKAHGAAPAAAVAPAPVKKPGLTLGGKAYDGAIKPTAAPRPNPNKGVTPTQFRKSLFT